MGIYFASIPLQRLTSERVLTDLFNMDAPTRYVFVSDASSPRIAVVDLLSQAQVSTIATQAVPDFLAINQLSGKLAYAQLDSRTLYLYDLATHKH